jgi:hypothetical protein
VIAIGWASSHGPRQPLKRTAFKYGVSSLDFTIKSNNNKGAEILSILVWLRRHSALNSVLNRTIILFFLDYYRESQLIALHTLILPAFLIYS